MRQHCAAAPRRPCPHTPEISSASVLRSMWRAVSLRPRGGGLRRNSRSRTATRRVPECTGRWNSSRLHGPDVDDRSAMPERGFALLDECAHALLLILEAERRVELAALEQQTFGERGFVCAVDRFLDLQHDWKRERRDLPRHGERFL